VTSPETFGYTLVWYIVLEDSDRWWKYICLHYMCGIAVFALEVCMDRVLRVKVHRIRERDEATGFHPLVQSSSTGDPWTIASPWHILFWSAGVEKLLFYN